MCIVLWVVLWVLWLVPWVVVVSMVEVGRVEVFVIEYPYQVVPVHRFQEHLGLDYFGKGGSGVVCW